MAESQIVKAKKRLTEALKAETGEINRKYEELKGEENKTKKLQWFAHELGLCCNFIDQVGEVITFYFTKNSVPVGLIKAMDDYYFTLKVVMDEHSDLLLEDPKLTKAISHIFLPYKQILTKMVKTAKIAAKQKGRNYDKY